MWHTWYILSHRTKRSNHRSFCNVQWKNHFIRTSSNHKINDLYKCITFDHIQRSEMFAAPFINLRVRKTAHKNCHFPNNKFHWSAKIICNRIYRTSSTKQTTIPLSMPDTLKFVHTTNERNGIAISGGKMRKFRQAKNVVKIINSKWQHKQAHHQRSHSQTNTHTRVPQLAANYSKYLNSFNQKIQRTNLDFSSNFNAWCAKIEEQNKLSIFWTLYRNATAIRIHLRTCLIYASLVKFPYKSILISFSRIPTPPCTDVVFYHRLRTISPVSFTRILILHSSFTWDLCRHRKRMNRFKFRKHTPKNVALDHIASTLRLPNHFSRLLSVFSYWYILWFDWNRETKRESLSCTSKNKEIATSSTANVLTVEGSSV